MNKKNLKKIICIVVFILLIMVAFTIFKNRTKYQNNNKMSIVRHVINEEYNEVVYLDDYYYAYDLEDDKYHYYVFTIDGVLSYSFKSKNKLNITYVSDNYFIAKEDEYNLYNKKKKLIKKSSDIEGLNKYLIKVDNTIINYQDEVLFKKVKSVTPYLDNTYFLVDNKLINEKGKVVLKDYEVVKEINGDSKYLLLFKDKYYTFYPGLGRILGSAFDDYYFYDNEFYLYTNHDKYIVYNNGFRKKVESYNVSSDKYYIKDSNFIDSNHAFVSNKNDESYGLLDIINDNYNKINEGIINNIIRVENGYIINTNKGSILYDYINNKVIVDFNKNINGILYFSNNYKCVNKENKYYLLDDNNREVYTSNKQIVLENEKILYGYLEDELLIYSDNEIINGKTIYIGKKKYIEFYKNDRLIVNNKNNKNVINKENVYLMNNKTVKMNNGTINVVKFDGVVVYNKSFKNYEIKKVYDDIIVLSNNKNILLLNDKLKVIRKINNTKIDDIIFIEKDNRLIILTTRNKHGIELKGSYLVE